MTSASAAAAAAAPVRRLHGICKHGFYMEYVNLERTWNVNVQGIWHVESRCNMGYKIHLKVSALAHFLH